MLGTGMYWRDCSNPNVLISYNQKRGEDAELAIDMFSSVRNQKVTGSNP
jgi:hypothetical protein